MAFCKTCGAEARTPAEAEPQHEPESQHEAVADEVPPLRLKDSVGSKLGSRVGSKRLLWISRGFLMLTLLGGGVLVGWAIGSDESLVEAEPLPAVADEGDQAPAADVDALTMPDVRGLSAADARQILADVGVGASVVSTIDQPAAGETGIVLTQDPVYGYPVEGDVTLSVSTPAMVPRFAGRSADDVLADLDQLGAEVETRAVYVPDVPVGQVASIKPVPGTLLPVAVTVVIAAEPDTLMLSDVVAVEDNCYSGDSDSIAGQTFNYLITCDAYEDPESSSWVVKRAAYRLTGTAGVLDSGDPGERMLVEVIGDGTVLQTLDVSYGQSAGIDIDLRGVLRLSIRYRTLGTDEDGDGYGTVGLGRLRLLGDASLLKTLETY